MADSRESELGWPTIGTVSGTVAMKKMFLCDSKGPGSCNETLCSPYGTLISPYRALGGLLFIG